MIRKIQSILLLVVVLFIVSILLAGHVRAETKVGFDWQYGKDHVLLPESWQSPDCLNTVNRFSIRVETNSIFPSWDKWFIGGEFQYSMHKADEKLEGGFGLGHDAGFR